MHSNKTTHPGFEGVDLAEVADELLAQAVAGNHTASALFSVADAMQKNQPVGVGAAAFLLGFIQGGRKFGPFGGAPIAVSGVKK